jgi:hypothetical protein
LALEDRVVPSTITWDNRGQTSDGFAAVFGANANLARFDVDNALYDWQNLISNFNYSNGTNTFHVSISVSSTGFGFNTSYGGSWVLNGKPTRASISIGGGSDGHGAGYYLDPTPYSYEEFEGTIINPSTLSATSGGPADGKLDLYSRITTALPLALGINDASNELFTGDPNHYLTNTGHADTVCPGTLWTYHGPDVNALFTSDNGCNSNRPNAFQIARPSIGNQVTSAGVTYFGADDVGAWAGTTFSRRYLPSSLMAEVLHDSYGYTINFLSDYSAYIDYNPTTHNVLVRDGSHGTGTYPSQNNPSNDTITLSTVSDPLTHETSTQIYVQIGNPTPGTGPNFTYSVGFFAAPMSSITLNTTDGMDTITLQNANALYATIPRSRSTWVAALPRLIS